MAIEASVQKIVNKVISLPLDVWKESKEEYYNEQQIQAYETKHKGRTLTVTCTQKGNISLWYDGVMITCTSNEIKDLFATLYTFQVNQQEEKRANQIEELAKLF